MSKWLHSTLSRRGFVQQSVAGAATLSAGPTLLGAPTDQISGANERINIGIIGVGVRGGQHLGWFGKIEGVNIAAVCDPDEQRANSHRESAEKQGHTTKACYDLREVLDDKTIDAVIIATPNHWHCLAGIWACQAGKDVYVEKPVSQNIWEGGRLVAAARKYDRIVQGGTQHRSIEGMFKCKAFLDSGALGKVLWMRSQRHGMRDSIGHPPEGGTPVPEHLHHDLWCGPGPDGPVMRANYHYDWHWFWDYGNGEMGNWGAHVVDDACFLLGQTTLPRRCIAGGGRFAWDDNGQTPNVQFAWYETDTVPVLFNLTNLPAGKDVRADPRWRTLHTGTLVQCENGHVIIGRGGGSAWDAEGNRVEQFTSDGGEMHAQNFIDCVRSRNREEQNAEIAFTHNSTAWCHTANMSYRLGGKFDRDEAVQRVRDFQPWQEMVDDFLAHLEANEIDPATADITLGAPLEFDPATETLAKPTTPEAQALMRRVYRPPYVVEQEV